MISVVPFGGHEIADFAILGRIGDAPAGLPDAILPPDASEGDAALAAQFWSEPQNDEATETPSVDSGVSAPVLWSDMDGVRLLARTFPDRPDVGAANASTGGSAALAPLADAALPPDASASDAEIASQFSADRQSDAPIATASLEPQAIAPAPPAVPPSETPTPAPQGTVPPS